MTGRGGLVVALLGLPLLSGCTALGISVASLGGAVVGAGAGAAVKAGTEYELGGAVARTFTVPLPELRQASVATFEHLDLTIEPQPDDADGTALVGRARNRMVKMRFEPVTSMLTRVQVTVSRSLLVKDLATAEEILAQIETRVNGATQAATK